MADSISTAPSTASGGRGSGRRRGRGGTHPPARTDEPHDTADGAGRGGKARGRGARGGRGGRGRGGSASQSKDQHQNGVDKPEPQPTPTAMVNDVKEVPTATDDADDGEICFICASTVEHTSVSPCNHRTCHICALRLRALYKNKGCAHCRVSAGFPCRRPCSEKIVANCSNLILVCRLNLPLLSLPMTPCAALKSLTKTTLLEQMKTWEFDMRKMRSLRTRSCYLDTIALTKTAMSPVLVGQIYTVM